MTNREQYEQMIIPIRCKNCIYYEEDSWVEICGFPIIVGHQICSKWGRGCKTEEEGYCHYGKEKENNEII